MTTLISTESSLDYLLDGLSLDEAIAYLQNLRDELNGPNDAFRLVLDCVDDISGTTALNLYSEV